MNTIQNDLLEWKKNIASRQAEVIALRKKLAAMLDYTGVGYPLMMERAEYFNDLLAREDEITDDLQRRVKDLSARGNLPVQTSWSHKKLCAMLAGAQEHLVRLQIDFNQFLNDGLLC